MSPVESGGSLTGIFRCVADGQARLVDPAGFDEISQQDADSQGQGGHDFEIDQGLDADAAYLFEVAHAADAGDDSEENNEGDEDFDDVDDPDTQRLHFHGSSGGKLA